MHAMRPLPPPELTRESMWETILDLRARMARLELRCAKLEAENKDLKEQLRESKRAKAPFSKGKRKPDPKPPGRKAGQGTFTRRAEPIATTSDEVREVDVPLPIDQRNCPQCQTPLIIREENATVEDTPKVPKRIITRFNVEVGKCPHCQYQIRGQHPELPRTQNGANAHVVGPQVMAQAMELHYGQGLPLRKVPQVILGFTGISLTQSALTQRACNLCDAAGELSQVYEGLRQEIVSSIVSHTDDTGWRISTVMAFMMGFFTQITAYYQIRLRHRCQEVQEVISAEHEGVVVTDRGSTYRANEFDAVEMQRCLSHLLTNLKKVEEAKSGPAKLFSSKLKDHLKSANELWKSYQSEEIDLETYRRRGEALSEAITHHLRSRELSDPDNQRLLDGIGLEHDNGRLLLFLERPEVPPTNNHAERMLRPAVIARKVSQCSKNERGARTYAMMKSIFVTFKLRAINGVNAFAGLLQGKSFAEACER
jgi:transposase